jgi:hypothetical protein
MSFGQLFRLEALILKRTGLSSLELGLKSELIFPRVIAPF